MIVKQKIYKRSSNYYFASVRVLLVKGLDHFNLPSTLELVCDVPSLLHAHTNKIQKMQIQILTNTYTARTHKHQHKNTVIVVPDSAVNWLFEILSHDYRDGMQKRVTKYNTQKNVQITCFRAARLPKNLGRQVASHGC